VVGLHVLTAFAFVYTTVYMQVLMARVMKRIPDGPDKQEAAGFIQTRFHPIVDGIILVLGFTIVYLAIQNWDRILQDHLLQVKLLFGLASLGSAFSVHFYIRYQKRSLARSGKDPDRLSRLTRRTRILEKVAMKTGILALFLGIYMNHIR
jgi:uncharacterized membrane protein